MDEISVSANRRKYQIKELKYHLARFILIRFSGTKLRNLLFNQGIPAAGGQPQTSNQGKGIIVVEVTPPGEATNPELLLFRL